MKILVVCSSNVCRSPYAEFILKKLVKDSPVLSENIEWVKSSAVFNRSKVISKKTRQCLLNEGFSDSEINAFHPTYKKDEDATFSDADIIIGMTNSHKYLTPRKYRDKFQTLSMVAYGKYTPIPDPFLQTNFTKYTECMNIIKTALTVYAEKLEKTFQQDNE